MDERYLKFINHTAVSTKLLGPKYDLFCNVSAKIFREIYGMDSYETKDLWKRMQEELIVLARGVAGLSEWSAKKVEISVALGVAGEFRPMMQGIDPEWPQEWKNTIYTMMGNVITYAIKRRANFDNPPSPSLSIVA